MLNLSGSTFRAPYSEDSLGNIIPHFVHKGKLAFGFLIKKYFLVKTGVTFYHSSQIFTPRKNSLSFDLQGVLSLRAWHLDLGIHLSNYTESIPPLTPNPAYAQYLSIGGGLSIPIKKKWAIDFTFRNSFNITLAENSFINLPEGFIGVVYQLKGNNNYLRRQCFNR